MLKKINKKIFIFSILGLGIISITTAIYFHINKKVEFTCLYKTGVVDSEENESYSEANLIWQNGKIKNINIKSYLYGEHEYVNNILNESENRKQFIARYNSYVTISKNMEVDGIDFKVKLEDNLITYVTNINYNKLNNDNLSGFGELKNKKMKDIKKYLENNNYVCEIKK